METGMNSTTLAAIVALATLVLMTPAAEAQVGGGAAGSMHPRHAMMMEKLAEACKGKADNDPCSFTRMNGDSANGTCITMRETLICRPAGMGHRHGVDIGAGHMGGPGAMRGGGAIASPTAPQ
jgi:hypothetical protein